MHNIHKERKKKQQQKPSELPLSDLYIPLQVPPIHLQESHKKKKKPNPHTVGGERETWTRNQDGCSQTGPQSFLSFSYKLQIGGKGGKAFNGFTSSYKNPNLLVLVASLCPPPLINIISHNNIFLLLLHFHTITPILKNTLCLKDKTPIFPRTCTF